jgi:hypothetical protein
VALARKSTLTQPAAARVAAKEQSRAADARALSTGEKTPEQLRAENSHFRSFAQEPILWDKVKRLS